MSSESRPEREREPRNGPEDETPSETGGGEGAGAASAPGAEPEQERKPKPEQERKPEPEDEAKPTLKKEAASAAGPDGEAEPEAADAQEPGAPVYADRCYRSPGALAGGVLLLLLAVWLGADALVSGDNRTRLSALFGLVAAVPLVVAFTLRPAVYASEKRMRVRNPFRTITVPWGAVEALRAGYSSEVVADGSKYQLWSIPVSLRARKRAARQTERAERAAAGGDAMLAPARPTGLFGLGGVPGADDIGEKRAPSDQAIDELRALAADHGESPAAQGGVTVRWAYEIAAPSLAGAVALAVLYAVR